MWDSKKSGKKKIALDNNVILEEKKTKEKTLFNYTFQLDSYTLKLIEKDDSKFELEINKNIENIENIFDNNKTKIIETNIVDDFQRRNPCKYEEKELLNLLNNFIGNSEIQDFFYEVDNSNDHVFSLLKKKEKEELLKFFNSKKSVFINQCNKYLDKKNNIIFDRYASSIINLENAIDVYSNKLKREIEKISHNENEFKVKHLTVMLVGKSGVGKSTLINGVLGEKKAKEGTGNFQTINIDAYKSESVPILRLVDTRGIELNEDYGPKAVKKDAENYINKQFSSNDTNNFVHCIWYCITGNRFEQAEIDLLNYLRNSYGDNNIPIIIVYTQATDETTICEMQNYIKSKRIEADLIRVLSKRKQLVNNTYLEAFGLNKLMEQTLDKCKKAMKGEMRSVMTKNITKYLKKNYVMKINILQAMFMKKLFCISFQIIN